MKLKAMHALLHGSNVTDWAQKPPKVLPDKTPERDVFARCLLQIAKLKPMQPKSPYSLLTNQNQIPWCWERDILNDPLWSAWGQLRLNLSKFVCCKGNTTDTEVLQDFHTVRQPQSNLPLRAHLCERSSAEESLHLSCQWYLTALC